VDDVEEDVDVFASATEEGAGSVPFDAEEDLDIPDFLKS
jgi:hypothetical protein